MTSVPPPGALSMSNVPFTNRTRSCMLARPRLLPFRGFAGSKPTPSSRTARSRPSSICRRVTLAALASAWRPMLFSASCATRNRHSAASFPTTAGKRFELHEISSSTPAALPFALRPECFGEAELVQDRRVQLVRQGVDVLAEPHKPFADRPHRLRLRSVRCGELGASGLDRQHGDPLRQVVVQFAREQRALLFVGADQSPAQIAQFVLDALAFGDVAEDAECADRASGRRRVC